MIQNRFAHPLTRTYGDNVQRFLFGAVVVAFVASPVHAQSFSSGYGTGNVLPYPEPEASSHYAQALPTNPGNKVVVVHRSAHRHAHKVGKY
jgi:hypothetical protein